jgi:hypothetical protein
VPNWRDYFFKSHADAQFKIAVNDGNGSKSKTFADLNDELIRDFREYSIPTIEIDMDKEEGGLKELIDLFIDINQRGVQVKRFDIVRTMKADNRLLSDVFDLVAIRQRRKGDNFYKMIDSDFTSVLKRLQIVSSLVPNQYQERVDRIWERLLEVVLFVRTDQHRTLAQILKAFLGAKVDDSRLTVEEMGKLRRLFGFLHSLYKWPGFKKSRLATDQPHFYTLVTSIHSLGLLDKYATGDLKKKLAELARLVSGKGKPPKGMSKVFNEYMELSSKQTTHPGRRASRQARFAELVEAL